jgi:hypothetical protein
MDFFELLPILKNKNTLILSFTDHFSKWVELFKVSRETEEKVAKCLVEEIIERHRVMHQLISDRG